MLRLERLLPSERGRPNHDNNDVGHHQTGTPSQYNEFRGQHSPQKTSSDIHDTTDDYQQLVQTFRHLQLFTVYMNRHHAEGTPLDGALVRSSQGISLSCIIELDRRHQAMARAAAAVSTSSSSESPLLTTTARQPDGDGQAQVEQLLRQRTLLARCLVLGISMMAFLAACFRLPRVVLPPDHGCCRHEPGHDRNLRGEFLQAYIEVLAVDVESGATAAREDSGGRVVTTWADDPGTTMRVGRSRDGSLAVFGHEARLEMWLLLMLQMSDTHGNHHHHNHYRDNQARCRQHQYGDPVSPGSTAPGPTANTQEQAESVVRHAWRRLVTDRGLSWEDVRAQVRQVIWMEAFFDGLGGPAFEALSRSVMEAYIAGG
ncbi:hypothetical protein Micbo1qcDRAFT_37270 [Microdochium bolleyi]|uniref:Uncharacterized protein n=1 Tax=Microdochium bolleyi TaxID=196109 RepID=A0A136IME9_9PEZI|nr:hypothetical protein Micbo1qcDRAFT_37270 [Microdochium bolleyi]